MPKDSVSIVILQFNNSEDTIRCIKLVKELIWPNFEVVVVDNASSPEHQQNIRAYVNSQGSIVHKLLALDNNLGYSGGNNAGIKYALEHGADYVFILNPDVSVKPDLLDKLIKKAESDKEIGIVGPAINESRTFPEEDTPHQEIDAPGRVRDESGRTVYSGKINWLVPELRHNIIPTTHCQLLTTNYVIGSSMLIKKAVFDRIGFLDEKYFLYFEDADFNVRAQKAGFKLAIEPNAMVYHKVSSSTSSLGPTKLLYYHYRNAHLFNIKNGPVWAKLLLPFWSIYVILKQLVKIIFVPKKRKISMAILRGVLDFYKGRFGQI